MGVSCEQPCDRASSNHAYSMVAANRRLAANMVGFRPVMCPELDYEQQVTLVPRGT